MEKVKVVWGRAKSFLLESKAELRKVSWPQPRQALSSTAVVIALVSVVALFLALVDFIVAKVLGWVVG